jgi:hypothetical protein
MQRMERPRAGRAADRVRHKTGVGPRRISSRAQLCDGRRSGGVGRRARRRRPRPCRCRGRQSVPVGSQAPDIHTRRRWPQQVSARPWPKTFTEDSTCCWQGFKTRSSTSPPRWQPELALGGRLGRWCNQLDWHVGDQRPPPPSRGLNRPDSSGQRPPNPGQSGGCGRGGFSRGSAEGLARSVSRCRQRDAVSAGRRRM